MEQVSLGKGIYWVGVHDHQTDLFEGLWPVQEEGVSYNSYLISSQKTALIDLASVSRQPLRRQLPGRTEEQG